MKTRKGTGKIFYRVEYQGRLSEYKIIEFKNDKPVYKITQLTDIRNDVYKLIPEENRNSIGTSNFGLELIIEDKGFFKSIDDAKKKSLERFNKEVNPNGMYKVARYFDDVWEAYESKELSKTDAKSLARELNQKPRHYVSYGIIPVS